MLRALFCLCLAVTALHRANAQTIVVGDLTLTHCIDPYDGYCGSLVVPLDPAGHVAGSLKIGFEFYPHTSASLAPLGTVIAQEGGPGYSTTGSRDGYVRLFTPLRDRRDILLIDKRGTGRSGVIDCRQLQLGRGSLAAVRACGEQLGAGPAWLYSSAYAADDVAAVLGALHTGPVDYYGDSYATFFGEVFAVRHPGLLRTLVLDSAYPVLGEGAFFASEIENGPVAFERACVRSPSCRAVDAQLGSTASDRFLALLTSLRAHPVHGRASAGNGGVREVTADAGALFTIVYEAGNTPAPYRDIDAAARAYLDAGDALPLLRLIAEAEGGGTTAGPAHAFSTGLALAVQCADYNQLYDMRAPEAARHGEFLARVARTEANRPNIFAPFTLAEALGAPTNPEALNLCQAWPAAPAWATPGSPVPADSVFPKIPVLVLSGELDTVTSPKEGALTTALFPNAYFVVVRNTGHETAVGDGGVFVPPYGADLARCAGPIVLAFVASGGDPGNTFCAAQVRPIRTVPVFAASWQGVAPAIPTDGNAAGAAALTLASAAAETVGDAVARYYVTVSGHDQGLRGGRFQITPAADGYTLHLDRLRWAADLAVTGVIAWNQVDDRIVAHIALAAPGHAGTLTIAWHDRERDAQARIDGTIDGQTVAARRIAP